VPVGSISYFRKSHAALLPKIQFVYDMFLPATFVPVPQDGEVMDFQLLTVREVLAPILHAHPTLDIALVLIGLAEDSIA
jgi:hypothetical protein